MAFLQTQLVHRTAAELTDEIAMNPAYFAVIPLLEILQTLVHEMCHAWQYHYGEPGRRSYHNKEWADKMEAIGLMPSSTGAPGGKRTGECMADYPIPGGPFMLATDELLGQGFGVTWLDREVAAHEPQENVESQADESADQVATVAIRNNVQKLLVSKVANSSNRVKYRCSSCENQVWGKPGLRILCGGDDCESVEFTPIG